MKNFILFVFFLFFLPGIYAQSDFPKNASEDKEKIMSDLPIGEEDRKSHSSHKPHKRLPVGIQECPSFLQTL